MNTDPTIKQLNAVFFQSISSAWLNRDENLLNKLGVDSELAHKIASLKLEQLDCLSGFKSTLFKPQFDVNLLNKMINNAQQEILRNDALDELIRCGASAPLIHELSGLGRTNFVYRARNVGRTLRSGRPEVLKNDEYFSLVTALKKHAHLGFSIDLFKAVYNETRLSLDRVWQAILLEPDETLLLNGIDYVPGPVAKRSEKKYRSQTMRMEDIEESFPSFQQQELIAHSK